MYKDELRKKATETVEKEVQEVSERSEKQNVQENVIIMTESIGASPMMHQPSNRTPTKAAQPRADFLGLPNRRRQPVTPNKPKRHKEKSTSNPATKQKND